MAKVRALGTFQNPSEVIEAGSISPFARITEEANPRHFMADDIGKKESLVVERVCLTDSGRYAIIARPKTTEEQARAARELWEGMTASLTRPDYILIGWRTTYAEHISAFYLRKTGPRFAYSMCYKIAWDYGRNRQIAKADGYGFCRFGRKEAVEWIERYMGQFHQCAPLWLLTSIPDLRPRYLAGKGT
jgi:hypothetical protein